MTQFMQSIPDELIDAARIDGAGELRIYWQIVLPLVRPALAALAIFRFMWSWNDFLWPVIVIHSTENKTLPIALAFFEEDHRTELQHAHGRRDAHRPAGPADLLRDAEAVRGRDHDDRAEGLSEAGRRLHPGRVASRPLDEGGGVVAANEEPLADDPEPRSESLDRSLAGDLPNRVQSERAIASRTATR